VEGWLVVVLSLLTCTVEALIIVMLGSVVDITLINMDLFKKKKVPAQKIVFENALCQSNVEAFSLERQFAQVRILGFGPYIPQFNPIETAGSLTKEKREKQRKT